MYSQHPLHFNTIIFCANRIKNISPECYKQIEPYLSSPDECFGHSKLNNWTFIETLENFKFLNKDNLSADLSIELFCLQQQIRRSFKIHIKQKPIDETLLHTSYGCNAELKTRMKKLINASDESFAQWADEAMKELQSLRHQCHNSVDREAIFCLITLETRLFSLKNPTLNKSFEAFKAHLNDKTLDIIAYPAHQYKMYETLPHDIVDKLNNIKYFTPNWFSRCINRFLALFATRPQSFFETHHASQLINKVSTHSLVAGV